MDIAPLCESYLDVNNVLADVYVVRCQINDIYVDLQNNVNIYVLFVDANNIDNNVHVDVQVDVSDADCGIYHVFQSPITSIFPEFLRK